MSRGVVAAVAAVSLLVAAGVFAAIQEDPAPSSIQYPVARTFVHGPGAAPVPIDDSMPVPSVEQLLLPGGAQEPDLDFLPDGDALFFAWTSGDFLPGGSPSEDRLLRSADGGASWSEMPLPPLFEEDPPIDPVVYRDPLSGRTFVMGHANYAPIHWTDDGETWTTTAPVVTAGVTDFPVLWSVPAGDATTVGDYPSVLFLCYYTAAILECKTSLDGGWTWALLPYMYGPIVTSVSDCIRGSGRMAGSTTDSTVYMPLTIRSGSEAPAGYLDCAVLLGDAGLESWVAVSDDLGLSWELVKASARPGLLRLATDDAGNAYLYGVSSDGLPWLTTSRDQGRTWSEPAMVGAPGVTAAKLPSIAAGADGRIAFFYVATTADDPAGLEATWHAYMGFSGDALAEAPVFATTIVSPVDDPVRRGDCAGRCEVGEDPAPCDEADMVCFLLYDFIGAPREGMAHGGMYDYTNIKIHPDTGMAWAAFVDLCTDACSAPGADASAGHSFRGSVAVQQNGMRLR